MKTAVCLRIQVNKENKEFKASTTMITLDDFISLVVNYILLWLTTPPLTCRTCHLSELLLTLLSATSFSTSWSWTSSDRFRSSVSKSWAGLFFFDEVLLRCYSNSSRSPMVEQWRSMDFVEYVQFIQYFTLIGNMYFLVPRHHSGCRLLWKLFLFWAKTRDLLWFIELLC